MAERPVRAVRAGVVTRVERLGPHMVRVVVGGPGVRDLPYGEYTDHYVKVQFPRPGVTYPEPFDPATIRDTRPRSDWPIVRTYTIRRFVPEAAEMWIDFVVHGEAGVAGPWAMRARPGDPFHFAGPGGGYTIDPAADWHLLAGDESALPAIAATLAGMPAGADVRAFIEVADPAEEQELETAAAAEIVWLHRGARPVGTLLTEAVRGLEFPPGQVQCFVHGEANFVKDLRGHLRRDRALPMSRLSLSGYWRRGLDEDGWQGSKREWNQQVEREQDRISG